MTRDSLTPENGIAPWTIRMSQCWRNTGPPVRSLRGSHGWRGLRGHGLHEVQSVARSAPKLATAWAHTRSADSSCAARNVVAAPLRTTWTSNPTGAFRNRGTELDRERPELPGAVRRHRPEQEGGREPPVRPRPLEPTGLDLDQEPAVRTRTNRTRMREHRPGLIGPGCTARPGERRCGDDGLPILAVGPVFRDGGANPGRRARRGVDAPRGRGGRRSRRCGALLVWGSACALTACTAASLAAMLTNARAGSTSTLGAIGGSLGRGVASLVGLPMWLARGFAVATAAFAIAESSEQLQSSEVLVALCTVVLAGVAAWQGAPLVSRAAPIALGAVALGLASTLAGPASARSGAWVSAADYGGLLAFVVPVAAAVWVSPDVVAATGEVRRPSPGWWALGISWLAQLAVIAWFTQVAPAATLLSNPRDRNRWRRGIPLVARLGLVVGAAYLAVASVADGARLVREVASSAVPSLDRPGMAELATTGVALAAVVSLRDLDGSTTALTLALLFAFAAINTVVGIELALGLTSFRPSIRLWPFLPVAGAVGAASAMLLTHAAGALAFTALVLGISGYLVRPGRTAREHSALISAVAEWLTRPERRARLAVRAWKPSMLVPVTDPATIRPMMDLLANVLRPEGSIRFLGTRPSGSDGSFEGVDRLADAARVQGLDSVATCLDDTGVDTTTIALQTLRLAVFRPNLLVVGLPEELVGDTVLAAQIAAARGTSVGVLMVGTPPNTPVIAARRTITLWVRSLPASGIRSTATRDETSTSSC